MLFMAGEPAGHIETLPSASFLACVLAASARAWQLSHRAETLSPLPRLTTPAG